MTWDVIRNGVRIGSVSGNDFHSVMKEAVNKFGQGVIIIPKSAVGWCAI